MDLNEYFENTKGFCVPVTSDGKGQVDAAVYARPNILKDGTFSNVKAVGQ